MTQAIFITGAASGMGRATALLFAAKGWFVGAFDVDEAGLETLRGELDGGRSLVQRLDVTDRDAFRAALAAFDEVGGGRLDILFNNAGISRRGHFDTQPFEHYAAMVQVNIMGVLNGVYEAVPLLKATPNSLCFTTSSSSTTFGMPGIAVYSATKHALRGLTEALSIEFKDLGIRVADVLPGVVATAMLAPATIAKAPKEGMWRAIGPEVIAQTVWDAYHGDKLHWFVPEEIAEMDVQAAADPESIRDMGGPFYSSPPRG